MGYTFWLKLNFNAKVQLFWNMQIFLLFFATTTRLRHACTAAAMALRIGGIALNEQRHPAQEFLHRTSRKGRALSNAILLLPTRLRNRARAHRK